MPSSRLERSKQILSLLAAERGVIGVYSPLMIGLSVAGVAAPFATGRFIDALACRQTPAAPFAILATLVLLKAVLSPPLQRFICARSRAIETDLQFRMLAATTDLEPSRLASVESGEIVAKLTRDTYAIGGFVRGLFPQLLQTAVLMFTAGCALFARSPIFAIAFTVSIPLTIAVFAPFSRRFAENSHRVRRQGDASFTSLFDFLTALPLLRILGAERRFADGPHDALQALKDGNDAADALSVRFGFLLGLFLVLGEIAVLGVAGSLAARGTIPVGDVVLYQMLFLSAIHSVQGVISTLPELAALREGLDSISAAFNRPSRERRHAALPPLKTLAFRHVTFAYPHGGDRPVIRDFSASLHAGSVIGLTGPNGAGKSTLLKLAVGALEPSEGEVLFNGRPLATIDTDAFRRRIGVVFQDGILVPGTIRDNLTLRDPRFTSDDIARALSASGFDAVVARLPDGLDTLVGNTRRTLSGGERQRLAVARAIIRDPEILVLDEATNHLDADSKKNLAQLVTRLKPGRIILLAGHDAGLDSLCDVKISCQISKGDSYIRM